VSAIALSLSRPGHRDDDRALVRAAQRGSEDAVEALVRRNWERAHRTAFLIVHDAGAAEDICQESMLAAVGALDGFDRGRPFGPWLHRIVVNGSLDWLRARKRRAEVATEDEHDVAEATRDQRIPGELAAALAALDHETRAIVVLRHLLDYSSNEIGAMLELPPATVRTRLRRALERLRAALEHERGIE
jgi:RNA polymerase sigma-70 factor (ECF subfamily)